MSSKDTKARAGKAIRAMEALGISAGKVKPVLKSLLLLYDKNWTLIEEENYRALADAIFERDDSEAAEQSKNMVNSQSEDHPEEETAASQEEPERPLKRFRRNGQASTSKNSGHSSRVAPLLKPKKEPDALPESSLPELVGCQNVAEPAQTNGENCTMNSSDTASQSFSKGKGKKSVSPKTSTAVVSSGACNPSGTSGDQQNSSGKSGFRSPPHTMRLRDRGKGSMSSPVPSVEKEPALENSSPGVSLKEPKVEPTTSLQCKENGRSSLDLIKPKDEPTDSDILCSNANVAIIDPSKSNGEDSNYTRKSRGRRSRTQEPSPLLSENEKGAVDASVPLHESGDYSGLPMNSGEHYTSLEIASSPFGEVKMLLRLDTIPEKTDFHMPNLEVLMKSVDEKCLRSPESSNNTISLNKVFTDTCQCFLELGTNPNSLSPKAVDVNLTNISGSKSPAAEAQGPTDLCVSTLNRSVDSLCGAELPHQENNGLTECAEAGNDPSIEVIKKPQATPENNGSFDGIDIAKGEEKIVITVANEVNGVLPPSFCYIPHNAVFQNAYVNFCLARIGDNNCCVSCSGDCLLSSIPCACTHETGGEFAYTKEGLVKDELLRESVSMNRDPKKHCQFFCKECPLERSKCEDTIEPCKGHLVRKFIKECWLKCGCSKRCGNRVVQRGITRNLQVFMISEIKGWGLRTLEDLPKGAFVCEYVGEVLTNTELFERVSRSRKNEKHSYPVLLDADWCAEGVLKDEEALCLDATHYGNVARFINHRCYDSSLVEIPVEIETPDHHYYHLAFFTTRKVKAMEELTWDYGIDFDDHDHPIKAFKCQCGSKFCRNIKRTRTRSSRR